MADTSYRRLDVDQYDEDRVLPSDLYIPDPRPATQVLSDTQGKAQSVRQLLQRGDVRAALGEVLDQPPYGEGVDNAKVGVTQSLWSSYCCFGVVAELSLIAESQARADLLRFPAHSSQAIALQSILSILNSSKSTDIPALISDLTSQEQVSSAFARSALMELTFSLSQVTLMKYLYKAMENLGETSGNVVLGWHEKVSCLGLSLLRRS